MWLLIYICAGMAAFMLLSVFSYGEYLHLTLSLQSSGYEKGVWFIWWMDEWIGYFVIGYFVFISVLYNNRKQNNTNNPVGADTEGKQ